MDPDFFMPLIWGVLIATAVFMYVLLDGFDLGLGILFKSLPTDKDRNTAMNSIAPFWDGNETWLVLGGGGLFAAFPLAYSIVMPALYMPVLIMLLALIFRGVAFEFRFKAGPRSRPLWDNAFAYGSLSAAFAQGLILGAFVQGIAVEGKAFAGGAMDWLTPFTVTTGIAVVCGYTLLGLGWLIIKTEDLLQGWAYEKAPHFLLSVLFFMALISAWMPILHSDIRFFGVGFDACMNTQIIERWFSTPNIYYLGWIPVIVAATGLLHFHALRRRMTYTPFLSTVVLFALGYLGLAVSLWPNIVPPGLTLWQTAAATPSLSLMFVGVVILLPVILGYTVYIYWVFRGKVHHEAGYH